MEEASKSVKAAEERVGEGRKEEDTVLLFKIMDIAQKSQYCRYFANTPDHNLESGELSHAAMI